MPQLPFRGSLPVNKLPLAAWMALAVLAGLAANSPAAPKGTPAPPGAIVIDDSDTARVKLIGGVTRGPGYGGVAVEGGTVAWIGRKDSKGDGSRAVIVRPRLGKPGRYEVQMRWFTGVHYSAAEAVPVHLRTAKGEVALHVNQKVGNTWVSLGDWDLTPDAEIRLSDEDAVGESNFDALRLLPAKAATAPKPLPGPAANADDIEQLRLRLVALLALPADADPADPDIEFRLVQRSVDAQIRWATLERGSERKSLWSDEGFLEYKDGMSTGGWEICWQYERLRTMAEAWAWSPAAGGFASRLQGNPALLKDILDALDWLDRNRFSARAINPAGGAWWWNEVAIPQAIADTCCLLGPQMPEELRTRLIATCDAMSVDPWKYYKKGFSSTGANRIWLCRSNLAVAVASRDAKRLERVRDGLSDVLTFCDRAKGKSEDELDGWYPDGSFLQHTNIPYNCAYGVDLIIAIGPILDLLDGTPWEYKKPNRENLSSFALYGLAPFSRGMDEFPRMLGRAAGAPHADGGRGCTISSIEALAAVLKALPPADAAKAGTILRRWFAGSDSSAILRRQVTGPYDGRPFLQSIGRVNTLLAAGAGKPAPVPSQAFYFHNMDFAVVHRPGWSLGISMCSTRIATHECIWSSNKRGWYQGHGWMTLLDDDRDRFGGNAMSTMDPYRLCGTTVDRRKREDGRDEGANQGGPIPSDCAGGVALADGPLLCGMELREKNSPLVARKSWLCLGDAVLCLGSGITGGANAVETTVENRRLTGAGANVFTVDGNPRIAKSGSSEELKGVRWAHLVGNKPGTDCGWFFPQPATLKALREERSGSWAEADNPKDDPTRRTQHWLTLWYEHGVNAKDAAYQYILLPGRTAAEVQAWAGKPEIEVLAAAGVAHAARSRTTGTTGAFFFAAGETAGAKADGPAAVLWREGAKEIEVVIAEPTQKAARLRVTLPFNAAEVLETDPKVTVEKTSPLTLVLDTAGSNGRPFRLRLMK